MIKLQNVEKTYTNGILSFKALNGINLHIKEGEFTSIIGSSGSGKSTIMNILGCLDIPSSGNYFLAGVDISKSTEDELAEIRNRKIGFVFQSFNLLPKLSAFENVELPMIYAGISVKERREKTLKALEMVSLSDKLKNRPPELSGGQRQRVAIARAIVNSPKIILADEPTGNLDSHSEVEIMNIFKELNRSGVTIVMVTHEPEIAANSRRVITVKDGIVIGDKETEKRGE
jgi:putative ABC transport system ATP-binding protein